VFIWSGPEPEEKPRKKSRHRRRSGRGSERRGAREPGSQDDADNRSLPPSGVKDLDRVSVPEESESPGLEPALHENVRVPNRPQANRSVMSLENPNNAAPNTAVRTVERRNGMTRNRYPLPPSPPRGGEGRGIGGLSTGRIVHERSAVKAEAGVMDEDDRA